MSGEPAPAAAPRISAVVPTFNRREQLREMLALFAAQTLDPADFEVVVIVDGCEDGTRELLEAHEAPFELRWAWKPNGGLSAARNDAIELARGEIVVLLDDDMRPRPQLLAAHLAAHEAGARRCVLGPAPIEVPDDADPLLSYIGRKFNAHLERLERLDRETPGAMSLETRDFYGGNFSAPRAELLAAGCFDLAFRGYGYEDIDLWLRLEQRGLRAVLAPEAIAIQGYDKTVAQLASDKLSEGANAVVLALKHPQAAGGLAFATDARNPRWWRAARALLLALTRRVPRTRGAVIALTAALHRRRLRRLFLYNRFVVEYFYWLGAGPALARARQQGHLLPGPDGVLR